MKTIIKECIKHNITYHILEKRGYYRCKKCRSEAVSKHRRNRKQKLISHFGGRCKLCGYDKCAAALDFHHLEKDKKEFTISDEGLTRSWKSMLSEAEKCVLVCCRCHREIESGLINL